MVDYAPLLTASGIVPAYDPSAPCAPRPQSPTYDPWGAASQPPPPRPRSPTYDPWDAASQSVALYDPATVQTATPVAPVATPVAPVAPAREIERLRFVVRSPEEIVKLSAVEVTTPHISVDGAPVRGGLRDPRFGPSAGIPCATCHATCSKPCQGHFGHYTLTEPLYNVHFIRQVFVWLRLVCAECGEVQVDTVDRRGVLRLTQWREKRCRKCEAALVQSMVWDKETQTIVPKGTETLSAKEALRRFSLVPDAHPLFAVKPDGRRLVHPRRLITTVLFVPSICLRPCVGGRDNSSVRGESDLTYRLVKIITCDKLLEKKKKQHSNDFISLRSALLGLQEAYTGYVDAGKTKRSARSGDSAHQPKYKSLSDMLRGKEGMFRGNLSGKRVDHASRGVIIPYYTGPHPTRVGVPKWMCEEMSVPEKVTDWNRSGLQKLVREKKVLYLERNGEQRVDLRTHPDPGRLQTGWVVHRQLKQGDVVLFNRQPTLHKPSMLALLVDVVDTDARVFWLPLQLTPGFNADFDGDEMNLHVPQTVEARAECYELLGAQENTLKASDGKASVVPVQGDRLATALMTKPEAWLTKSQWYMCLSDMDDGSATTENMLRRARENAPTEFPVHARRLWSLALPDNYNWTKGDVRIVRGVLVAGSAAKKVLLQLVHDITLDRSGMEALNFQHGVARVCNTYNTRINPSTIYFSEISPSKELTEQCRQVVKRTHALSRRPGADPQACMAKATQMITGIVHAEQSEGAETGMKDLVASGAKGNPINFTMMAGVLGKMLSETEKVFTAPEGEPADRRRCFTTSRDADDFMDAYVPSGYAKGMNLQQYFIHAAAGRMGLISSTQLVGKVGYMFRRLVAALESCCTYLGTVVDTSTGAVVSFRYGDDGRSPYSCEWERLVVPQSTAPTREFDAALEADVDAIHSLFPDASDRVFDVPVSTRRVLFDAANRIHKREELGVLYTPKAMWKRVQQIAREHEEYAGGPFIGYWLRVHLHPYALCRLSAQGASWAVEEVHRRMLKSRVPDGESVGHLTASAISAASTQFTLNSFHNIGSEGGSYAGLEETINLNKSRKNPRTQFRLRSDLKSDLKPHANVQEWVQKHKLVTLRDVVVSRGAPKPEDQDTLKTYWEFPDEFPDEPQKFEPAMRLEVRHPDPFEVRMALWKAGIRHAAYAENDQGVLVVHTDVPVTTLALNTVVSGSVLGCTAVDELVMCTEITDMGEHMHDIDLRTYWTNNFHETRKRLGIEAARATIVSEMKRMLRTFGVSMQARNVELVADRCTFTGELLGCTRHGMAKRNPERTFHASAFEQPTQVLANAAAAGFVDPLKGAQESQIVGRTGRFGTHHPWLNIEEDTQAVPVPFVDDDSEEDEDLDFADGWIPQPMEPMEPTAMLQDPWNPRDPWAPRAQHGTQKPTGDAWGEAWGVAH